MDIAYACLVKRSLLENADESKTVSAHWFLGDVNKIWHSGWVIFHHSGSIASNGRFRSSLSGKRTVFRVWMQTCSSLSRDCLQMKMQFSTGSTCLCLRQDSEILTILSSKQFWTVVISTCSFVSTSLAGKLHDNLFALNQDSLAMMGLNVFENVLLVSFGLFLPELEPLYALC